jgi:hypothetical protein
MPPSEDNLGYVPHHDDVHGSATLSDRQSSGMKLNYLGMAALACVIVWLALKDRVAGKPKISSPALPAHHRVPNRW